MNAYQEKNDSSLQVSSSELFFTFSKMSIFGFGGVGPFIYSTIVEEKNWMTPKEFTELLAMGQLLPGANVTNFAVMFGYRVNGWRGALYSVFGLLLFPFLIILGLGVLYNQFGNSPVVIGALRGILAVSAGLILVTSLKIAVSQFREDKSYWPILLIAFTIVAMTVLSIPLPAIVMVLGTIAIIFEWRAFK